MKKIVFFLGIFMIISLACSFTEKDFYVVNITQIYMHEPHSYTFAIENIGSNEITLDSYSTGTGEPPKIIHDVGVSQKKYARIHKTTDSCGKSYYRLTEIHIHGIEDINPAGWNHGKFGRGQTTVLE